jgi:two-component system, OmpR family, alkaline phosphatase synthesis response regulator PhoP
MPDKILIVDDEKDILRIIAFSLEKWGYEVITADNGKEGLDKVACENPDLILLDAGMPVMNGFEMLEHLYKNPDFRHIPVIMLTANSDPKSIDIARAYNILEYVTKPFDPIELRERIENVLSHSK